ncbi:MAG: hypothetical protein Fur0023_03860 [Bacteroidia bacterium]
MNTKYDAQLKQIPHYQKFPQMLPFIGDNYDNICGGKVKILVLGESHYFPKESNIHTDAKKWYNEISEKDLNEIEKDWIDTREIVEGEWKSLSHLIFALINEALAQFKQFQFEGKKSIQGIAFMNAFQRPSVEEDSIKNIHDEDNEQKDIDVQESCKVLKKVIEIIQPNLVIVVSKYTWYNLSNCIEIKKDCTNHTAAKYNNGWWISEDGRDKFINTVQNHLNENCR